MEATRLAGPVQPACGFVQTASGARVSWKNNLPVKVYISSSWPRDYFSVVERAAASWNESTGRNLLKIVSSGSVSSQPMRDHRNGLYWMNTWPANKSNQQAVTTLYYSGGVPYDADIKVDAHYFTYFDDEWPDKGEYHLTSLLVHELGHLLGLAHAYTPRTVMSPFLYPFDRRVELTPEDFKAIKCEYPK